MPPMPRALARNSMQKVMTIGLWVTSTNFSSGQSSPLSSFLAICRVGIFARRADVVPCW